MIALAVLHKSARDLGLPLPLKEFMNLSETALTKLPYLWKEVVAYRFSFIFSVLRKLDITSVSLSHLLGPNFYTAADIPEQFQLNLKLPTKDGVRRKLLSQFRITKQEKDTRKTFVDLILDLKEFVTKGQSIGPVTSDIQTFIQ